MPVKKTSYGLLLMNKKFAQALIGTVNHMKWTLNSHAIRIRWQMRQTIFAKQAFTDESKQFWGLFYASVLNIVATPMRHTYSGPRSNR